MCIVVMVTSLLAAAALFVVFFGVLAIAPKGRTGRVIGSFGAAAMAGLAWTGVVVVARALGWVRTEEAQFHHLYVLGAVGLPTVGLVIVVASLARPVKDRRARIGGRVVAGLFIVPAFVGLYATNIEPQWLRVDRGVVGDGAVSVAVVADIQTDEFGDYERRVMETTTAQEPDLVLFAGDLTQVEIHEYGTLVDDASQTLSLLSAPGGVFAVSGNTDPSAGSIDDVADRAGISALDDDVVEIDIAGTRVRLLGLSWPNNRRATVTEALASFSAGSSADTVDIVLAHSPDVVFNLSEDADIDLVVTGHTHGGQIQVPFYGPIWNVTELPREIAAGGLHEFRGVPLYVSTGVGVNRGESPKVRFGARPSIGLLDVGDAG